MLDRLAVELEALESEVYRALENPKTHRMLRHMEEESVVSLSAAAVALSLFSAVLLVAGWVDIRRRPLFPGAEHGSLRVSGRRMKWVWGATLLAAFVAGGPEIASQAIATGPTADAQSRWNAPPDGSGQRRSVAWNYRIAAYHYSGSEVRGTGESTHRAERMALHAPIWLPLALLAYWLVIARPALLRREVADQDSTPV